MYLVISFRLHLLIGLRADGDNACRITCLALNLNMDGLWPRAAATTAFPIGIIATFSLCFAVPAKAVAVRAIHLIQIHHFAGS